MSGRVKDKESAANRLIFVVFFCLVLLISIADISPCYGSGLVDARDWRFSAGAERAQDIALLGQNATWGIISVMQIGILRFRRSVCG